MFAIQLTMAFSTFFTEFYEKFKSSLNTITSGLARTLKSYNNFVIHYPLLSMAITTGFDEDHWNVNLNFDSKGQRWVWEVLSLKR